MDCARCCFGILRKRSWLVKRKPQIECAVSGRWRGTSETCDLGPGHNERQAVARCAAEIVTGKRTTGGHTATRPWEAEP